MAVRMMNRSVPLAGILLTLSAAGAALSGTGGPASDPKRDLAPPVEVAGSRIQIESLSATVKVVGAPNPSPGVSRSITVNGRATPLQLARGTDIKPDGEEAFPGSTAVLWSEVVELSGDDRAIELRDVRRQATMGHVQRRRQLGQSLVRNVHQLIQRPPQLSYEQLMAMQAIQSNFSAHAQLDALPAHIDRMVVGLDVVHASELDIVGVPLEVMEEHKELIPGVRFLISKIEPFESNGQPYMRIGMEYFIDRIRTDTGDDNKDDADSDEFEATPIIPAIAIRDAAGNVLHYIQHAQEIATRDAYILSIDDTTVRIGPEVARPLRVDVVILHGLERHAVEMVVEDVALAGE